MYREHGFLHYRLDVGYDQQLQVISDPGNVLGPHNGNGIWTSAHELVLFLCKTQHQLLRNRCVLELGRGWV